MSFLKPDAPPAPDYAAAAAAQGTANRETAIANNAMNRVNQYSPQGSSTWTLRPGADPNNPQVGDYTQTVSLSPGQQALYDYNERLNTQLMEMAGGQLTRVNDAFNSPVSTAGLPGWQTSHGRAPAMGLQTQQPQRPLAGGATGMSSGTDPNFSPTRRPPTAATSPFVTGGGATPGQPGYQAPGGQQPAVGGLLAGMGKGMQPPAPNGAAPQGIRMGTGIQPAAGAAGGVYENTGRPVTLNRAPTGTSIVSGPGTTSPRQTINGVRPNPMLLNGDAGIVYNQDAGGWGGVQVNPDGTQGQPGQQNRVGAGGVPIAGGATPRPTGPGYTGEGSGLDDATQQTGSFSGRFGAGTVPTAVDDTSRQRVEEAILSRLEPQYQQDENRMRNQLLSQGLEVGTPAYAAELDRLARAQNDARMQAVLAGGTEESRQVGLNANLQQQAFQQGLQGSQFDNQTRQQMLAEMMYLRNLPLNELNALRSGGQVSMPTFGSYYTNNASPAPVFDAAGQQANYNMGIYNGQVSGSNALLGGLVRLGTAAFGG